MEAYRDAIKYGCNAATQRLRGELALRWPDWKPIESVRCEFDPYHDAYLARASVVDFPLLEGGDMDAGCNSTDMILKRTVLDSGVKPLLVAIDGVVASLLASAGLAELAEKCLAAHAQAAAEAL